MLVSDLDGTLLGDEEALGKFAKWVAKNRSTVLLVYATGRFFDSVAQVIRTTRLPEPDAVIGAVGTDIYDYPSGEILKQWHEQVKDHWDPQVVRRVLRDEGALELQGEEFQSDFKVSYYIENATLREIEAFKRRLQAASVNAEMIYSSNRDLDFLPAGMNKGAAVAFLASRWNITPENVLVAGDTGNDRALFEQGFPGIVVANAQPELKAITGPNVFRAQQSYASGVMEGIQYCWEQR